MRLKLSYVHQDSIDKLHLDDKSYLFFRKHAHKDNRVVNPDAFEGFYPHEYSCDKYWECKDGKASLELCGNGLGFADTDPTYTTKNCDYLYSVNCGNRSEVEPPISAPNCPLALRYVRGPRRLRRFLPVPRRSRQPVHLRTRPRLRPRLARLRMVRPG